MKRAFSILIFIVLQLAAIAVLTLWIVWYALGPDFGPSVLWLIQGILLMLPIIFGATFIFIYLNKMNALDNLRTNFISSISHELLTPLASIKLYLETMLFRDLNKEKTREFHALMLEDAERLSLLISKILITSRIEKKKQLFSFKPMDLEEVLNVFFRTNSNFFTNVKLFLDFEKKCICSIDLDSFNMVLKNTFENAIKYSSNPVEIQASLKKTNNTILLTISDNGKGIETKNLKKIFNMFHQEDERHKGTGLGLYIVKNIIKAHKGRVWAESKGAFKGTTLNFELPLLRE